MLGPTREDAGALDQADPLGALADRFAPLPADVLAYLDGNSLGRPSRAVATAWTTFPDLWADRLIRGWEDGWIDLPVAVGDELGAALLGAAAGQIVVADSTTICFTKALVAAVRQRPGRDVIVLDRDHFPTNRYVAESVAAQYGLRVRWSPVASAEAAGPAEVGAVPDRVADNQVADDQLADHRVADQRVADQRLAVDRVADNQVADDQLADHRVADQRVADQRLAVDRVVDDLIADHRVPVDDEITPGEGRAAGEPAVFDDRVAVVAFGAVDYRTARIADVAGITERAHRAGALTVWDLSHAVGVVPLHLDADRVDFAVGATYKFVGAGPGSPAFCYVAARHVDAVEQPLPGWLGRADPFGMAQGYVPAPGIRRMVSGTPPVPALLAVRAAVRVLADAGIEAIRAKSIALTAFTVALVDARLPQWRLVSPRDPARAGGHVSLARADARAVCRTLAERGVLADFREPDILRLGLSPLTTRFTEVWDALDLLQRL